MHHDAIPRRDADCLRHFDIEGLPKSPVYHTTSAMDFFLAWRYRTHTSLTHQTLNYNDYNINEQYTSILRADANPGRPRYKTRLRPHPVLHHTLASQEPRLATTGTLQDRIIHSLFHRFKPIKYRGSAIFMPILLKSMSIQRTPKHINNCTPVQYNTVHRSHEPPTGDSNSSFIEPRVINNN